MARSYREVRKQKIVRNVTILCACLVVIVMVVERGILSSSDEPISTTTSKDKTQPTIVNVEDTAHNPPPFALGLNDDDGISSKFAPSSASSDDSDDVATSNPPNPVIPNDPPPSEQHAHDPPSNSQHQDATAILSTTQQSSNILEHDIQTQQQIKDAYSQHSSDKSNINAPPDHIPVDPNKQNPNTPIDPLSNINLNNNNIPADSKTTDISDPHNPPAGSDAESNVSTTTNNVIGFSDESASPHLLPNVGVDSPYADEDDEEHYHAHDDDDELPTKPAELEYPSDDVPRESTTINIVNPNDEAIPVSPTNGTTPTTFDPIASEKLKKKEKEKEEKDNLERKVRKEYADEMAGIKSNITVNIDSTSLLLPKPLLFVHVPKTAGSTLAQIFKKNSPSGKYYHFWNHPRLDDLRLVPDKEVIFGHFRYGLHFYMPNQTASYATMLREPVERVISYPLSLHKYKYYYFHLQDPQDPAHQFAKEHTFEEWLEVSDAAQNEMTKCLSGIRSEFYPSPESFEMAKHHLRSMGYVGLTERFGESLKLMKYYFGFKDLAYDNVKVGVKKPIEIEDAVKEKIRERNKMDIELYEMAKEIFDEQLGELSKYLLQQELKS